MILWLPNLTGTEEFTHTKPGSAIFIRAANAHTKGFIEDLFPRNAGIPANFQGVLTITSDQAIAPVTLRYTVNQRGEDLYSALPVADLNNPPLGPLYLQQIADGGGFTTQIILINTSYLSGNITVNLSGDVGDDLSIPFH